MTSWLNWRNRRNWLNWLNWLSHLYPNFWGLFVIWSHCYRLLSPGCSFLLWPPCPATSKQLQLSTQTWRMMEGQFLLCSQKSATFYTFPLSASPPQLVTRYFAFQKYAGLVGQKITGSGPVPVQPCSTPTFNPGHPLRWPLRYRDSCKNALHSVFIKTR